MKLFRILLIVFLAANFAGIACAQYGLYGSPDPLRLPQQGQPQTAAVPYDSYSAPYSGQTGGVPGVYSQQVAPYNAPSGYVAPPAQYAPPTANPAVGSVYRTASARPAYVPPQASPTYPSPAPTTATSSTAQDSMLMLNEPALPQNPTPTIPTPAEQGQTGAAGSSGYVPYNSSGGCRSAVNQYQEAAACGEDLGCCYNSCPWYVSLTALGLTRNNPNKLWLSNEPFPTEYNQLMNSQNPEHWQFGGEIKFGRRFCCDCCDPCGNNSNGYWAIEADYWTTIPFSGSETCVNPNGGTLGTPLVVGDIAFKAIDGSTQQGTFWFNDATEQRFWRHDEIQSVEINLVHGQWANVCGSNWDFAFSIGPRFFRFDEQWRFGALKNGYAWGQDGGAWEAYLSDHVTNDLWGAQIGCDLGYNFGRALRVFVTPKVGIYDNNITNNFQAYLGNGNIATVTYPGQTGSYPVNSSANSFSVLAQVDVGAEWFFAPHWSLRGGYRLVALSGIGLADNQIPPYINDVQAIADIDTNGELFIHGAFATLTWNF